MGRGDKRSKRGKIWRGSHGNTRPKAKKKQTTTATTTASATAGN